MGLGELTQSGALKALLSTAPGGSPGVAGSVSLAGAILTGSGFTVTKTATGVYRIDFATPFASPPVVLVDPTGTNNIVAYINPLSASSVTVNTVLGNTSALTDAAFNFSAFVGVAYVPTPMSDKTVGGQVASTGAIVAGTGYTVAKPSAGTYDITFTTPFPSAPTVVVAFAADPGGSAYNQMSVSSVSTTGCRIVSSSGGGRGDAAFNFVATLGFTYTPSTLLGRMIAGSVGSTGAVVAGAGFTVTKGAAGVYTINFTNPFPTVPIVLVDGLAATGNPNIISVPSTTQVVITLGTSDQPFNFIACDPNLAVASSTMPAAGATLAYLEDTTAAISGINGVQTVITAPAVTCDGATPITVEYSTPNVVYNAALQQRYELYMDGVSLGILWSMTLAQGWQGGINLRRRLTPAAGAHVFSIRIVATNAGGVTDNAGAGGAAVLMPRFIHIRSSP